jgi:hypothetical protein
MNRYLATFSFIIVLRCFSVYTSFTLFSALSTFTPISLLVLLVPLLPSTGFTIDYLNRTKMEVSAEVKEFKESTEFKDAKEFCQC